MNPPFPRPGLVALLSLLAGFGAHGVVAADKPDGRLTPDFAALSRELLRLPAPPAWSAGESATLWTVDDVRAAFARATDTPPEITQPDAGLLVPSIAWLRRYNDWFDKLERPLRLRFEDQQWDCDNYAHCFVTFADLLAMRAGEKRGALAVGWASVLYRHPFAGIGAGTAHAVVVVAASDGLYVIEPQNGTMISLEKFPNRDSIAAVYF